MAIMNDDRASICVLVDLAHQLPSFPSNKLPST